MYSQVRLIMINLGNSVMSRSPVSIVKPKYPIHVIKVKRFYWEIIVTYRVISMILYFSSFCLADWQVR